MLQSARRRPEINETKPDRSVEALNDGAWFLATCPVPGTREPQRAVEWAIQAVPAKPGQATLWNTLGVAHYRDENWPAALAALQKSMDLQDGGTGFDWFFLAMIHWQMGEKDDSRNWFDKAVEWMDKNGPHDDELTRFRTEAHQACGHPHSAGSSDRDCGRALRGRSDWSPASPGRDRHEQRPG